MKRVNADISSANYDEMDLTGSESTQEYLLEKQKEVDAYNEGINTVHPFFANRKFVEGVIIVRLLKFDFLKKIEVIGQESYIRAYQKMKVPDGHDEHGREKYKYVENLLPYKFEGVVVSFDETLKEKHTHLEKGLKVQLVPFNILDFLYYPDREREDEPWTPEDVKEGKNVLSNFEGYVKVRANMIESYEV